MITKISEDITAFNNLQGHINIKSDYSQCILTLEPTEALALLNWLQDQRTNIEALQAQENTK